MSAGEGGRGIGPGGRGRVILVGAGPGDPDLITVRGAAALREADVVFYDQLASEANNSHRRTNNYWPTSPTLEIPTVSAGAAAAGGAGAAEQQRRQYAEEEEMTPYSHKDRTEDWEFKILRSMSVAFRKPESLAAILEEEGKTIGVVTDAV